LTTRWLAVLAGPVIGAIAAFAASGALEPAAVATIGVAVWTAVWWLTEAVEIGFASLVPLAMLPMFGAATTEDVARGVGHDLVLLLLSGFLLSTSLEDVGAHRQLALRVTRAIGGRSGRAVLWGFLVATTFVSMWISNSAATLMMMPVARAVLDAYPDRRLDAPLVLAIAYGASVGGLGTPIGSPPNLVFVEAWARETGEPFGFFAWMRLGIPLVVLLTSALGLWLGRGLAGTPPAEVPDPGPWTSGQRRALSLFAVVAVLWATRTDPWGGWSAWWPFGKTSDASVGLLGVLVLGLSTDREGERLLSWSSVQRIPWGSILLFGSGIALANAMEKSGLSAEVAAGFGSLEGVPVIALIPMVAAGVTLLSEVASNTAAAVLLMPVLAEAARVLETPPGPLMFTGVLAASCGFMLPVATAPNAIAHGTGLVSTRRMALEGLVVDAMGVAAVTVVCWWGFA
jgi:sodium-dependent dicarboxylate transporter 2/3/5